MGEYHDIFLARDAFLLMSLVITLTYRAYGLDFPKYVSMASFSLDTLLKGANTKPELLTNPDMYIESLSLVFVVVYK